LRTFSTKSRHGFCGFKILRPVPGIAISPAADETQRLIVPDGTLEALKWIGLVSMTLDHINKYIFSYHYPWMFEFGRLAMPLFAFVLAYNLARPRALLSGSHVRSIWHRLFFGTLALPFYTLLNEGMFFFSWYPLNIMFMLLAATYVIYLLDKERHWPALLIFLLLGALVEYWWLGLACCLSAWWYCKSPGRHILLGWLAMTSSLVLINGNFWALTIFPLVFLARYLNMDIPRFRYVFYVYYPLHLAAIMVLRRLI